MSNWRTLADIVGPNLVSKTCALLSAVTLVLPWLVTRKITVHSPGQLIMMIAPPEFYSVLSMAGAYFDIGFYEVPHSIAIAALAFIAGTIVAWWSPIGGVLQVGSVYSIAILVVQANYTLYYGVVTLEVGFSIGFYIGSVLALVTVFSLCPSGRNALMRAFGAVLRRPRAKTA